MKSKSTETTAAKSKRNVTRTPPQLPSPGGKQNTESRQTRAKIPALAEHECVQSTVNTQQKLETTPSPRQTARRKIHFDSSNSLDGNGHQESCLSEAEFEIPRRKKLRSEVTEDELWEGFPQVVRFKRLTPQKNQTAKSQSTFIDTTENSSYRVDTQEKPSTSRENNIFTDFSKFLNLQTNVNVSDTVDTESTNKRYESITPKRSARLKEKRESPMNRRNDDFVYTPLKKTDDTRKDCKSEQLNVLSHADGVQHQENTQLVWSNSGDIFKVKDNVDNEVMKQLYKDVVVKEHSCSPQTYTRVTGEHKEVQLKDKIEHSSVIKASKFTKNAANYIQNSGISENVAGQEEETSDEHQTEIDNPTEFESKILHDAENIEIDQVNIVYKQTKDSPCLHDSKQQFNLSEYSKHTLNDHLAHETTDILKIADDPVAEVTLEADETNICEDKIDLSSSHSKCSITDASKTQTRSETVSNDVSSKTEKRERSALKLRLRKKDNGVEIIHPVSTDDHAYVLSSSKGKDKTDTTKKRSDSNKGGAYRKKILQKEDKSITKRRSPRVANASSVGKGPGMAESDLDESTDMDKESVCSNTRQEKPKKKQVSGEEKLLQNSRVEKDACMLWSSERRRHFQQLHSNSTADELDNIMRTAWEKLDKKDKLRYFTRACNATRDENKHLTTVPINLDSKEDSDDIEPSSAMQKFLNMSPHEQDYELKRWLKLFYEVSPSEYAKLKTLEKPKKKKEEWKSKENEADHLHFYRKVLYQSILDSKSKIKEIYNHKKQKQQESIKKSFELIVKRLITGKSADDMNLSRDFVSQKLAEVLLDLQYLENERKVGVSGAVLTSKSYETLLEDLKEDKENSTIDPNETNENEAILDDEDEGNEFSQKLLDKVADTDLPLLEVESVTELLENASEIENDPIISQKIFEQISAVFENQAKDEIINYGSDESLEIRNPSSILNNWVLADQFKALSMGVYPGAYNSMYSLIDRQKLLPFLQNSYNNDKNGNCGGSSKPDTSNNNSSKPKSERVRYQTKIDRLCYQRPPFVATQSIANIRMAEPSGINKLQATQTRPTLQIRATHAGMSPTGQTFVNITSQSGRCRIFSVRPTK